jgi:hypothetical protein
MLLTPRKTKMNPYHQKRRKSLPHLRHTACGDPVSAWTPTCYTGSGSTATLPQCLPHTQGHAMVQFPVQPPAQLSEAAAQHHSQRTKALAHHLTSPKTVSLTSWRLHRGRRLQGATQVFLTSTQLGDLVMPCPKSQSGQPLDESKPDPLALIDSYLVTW